MLRIPQRTAASLRASKPALTATLLSHPTQTRSIQQESHQTNQQPSSQPSTQTPPPNSQEETVQVKKKKTLKELDEELRLKMEGLSGEGGESGVEYEDGKPVAMKRGVRDNMFRYI
ncbi:hypothetical protein QBC41DRAFT_59323 [Cercophora samala]|uniref:Uncharacterized protein n=1 Tax=Cercophora samala TaxID=330535 RepID=A0AA40CXK8_9PEZI|nr:hypothetical protein QBC41DRAFT_59323 [Cercophora samala]